VDAMADDPLSKKHSPRFLLATDGEEVCVRDCAGAGSNVILHTYYDEFRR